jgi:hypothetical protein
MAGSLMKVRVDELIHYLMWSGYYTLSSKLPKDNWSIRDENDVIHEQSEIAQKILVACNYTSISHSMVATTDDNLLP